MEDKALNLFNEVVSLFNKGKIDSALVHIFMEIDNWDIDIDSLFRIFIGVKLSEVIYVGLLSATIFYKKNASREAYFDWVKIELENDELIKDEEIGAILSGL